MHWEGKGGGQGACFWVYMGRELSQLDGFEREVRVGGRRALH